MELEGPEDSSLTDDPLVEDGGGWVHVEGGDWKEGDFR